jgi:hypothetical protein
MASGHVNRIYRPNTWQHRPSLRREDFSCQPGAVHTWHLTDLGVGANARFAPEAASRKSSEKISAFQSEADTPPD